MKLSHGASPNEEEIYSLVTSPPLLIDFSFHVLLHVLLYGHANS